MLLGSDGETSLAKIARTIDAKDAHQLQLARGWQSVLSKGQVRDGEGLALGNIFEGHQVDVTLISRDQYAVRIAAVRQVSGQMKKRLDLGPAAGKLAGLLHKRLTDEQYQGTSG